MKPKNNLQPKSGGVRLLEIAFLALPFLALIPNFFIVPDLTYPGLATQEVVFAVVAAVFAALGLIELVRSQTNPLTLLREHALMFACLSAFILWQLVSLAWAPAAYDGVRVSGIWFGFAVFFVAGITSMRRPMAEVLHYVLTLLCAILAISLLYERATFGDNMLGIFFNHGITSELLVTLLPLQLVNFLCNRKVGLMIVSLLVSGLSLLALLVGLRRGAIIGTVFVLIALGLGMLTRQIKLAGKQRVLLVAAVLVVSVVFVGVRYREAIAFRIQGATQLQSTEGGLTTRLRGWITAWEMGKRHALIGVGNGGYPNLYGEYRKYFVSNTDYAKVAAAAGAEDYDEIRSPLVHNEYLQLFVELGIIGVALFALFWLLVIRRLWRGRNAGEESPPWVFGSLLGLLAFGISSAFSSFSLRFTPGTFVVACVLSIGFAFARREENSEEDGLRLPKVLGIAVVAVGLVGCLAFAARAYNVYAGQLLQGRASLRTEPLDFNFFPDRPAENERLARRYQQVLELDSENSGARLGYGLLLYQMKRPAEAIPQYEQALKKGYSRPFAYVALAFAYEQAGRLPDATKVLGDCVASFPQSVFARAAYAEMLRKEGKIDLSREQQKAMYALNERDAQSWEVALRLKREDAMAEANRRNLTTPDKLWPILASTLVNMRAYHYLK
ncbi:MAG TPA: O-antigen ligase family protein [Blastocatellia bacterium]|nr:O-antigen ligase family protein [Blastocatellia bacterium]HMV83985.1 O-antigen ligase family protein [Blastocatellia bacterium]HMX30120.1 O-antigen ligase family protein [Blastocatellia bacterium]HMZ18202.1 O-antigen ligase family protein [Blastocatellia bacterium]